MINRRIALLCQLIYPRSTRIRQAHDLGTLVKRLAGRVVDSLTDNLHIVVVAYQDNLAVATTDQKAQKRERGVLNLHSCHTRRGGFEFSGRLHEMGENMPLQVVDINERNPQREG